MSEGRTFPCAEYLPTLVMCEYSGRVQRYEGGTERTSQFKVSSGSIKDDLWQKFGMTICIPLSTLISITRSEHNHYKEENSINTQYT